MRVATAVLGRVDGADDVVQVASERAWRSLATLDVERGFRPWFLGAVANTARNDKRASGRRQAAHDRAAVHRTNEPERPDDRAVATMERSAVVAALNELSPTDRLVVTLRHVEQMSEAEIADVLACPVGTVKSRHSRALARLRASPGLKAVIVAAVVVLVSVLAVRPAREAVADWLGLRSTVVRVDPSARPVVGELVDGGRTISTATAFSLEPWLIGRRSSLGPPDMYVAPPEGGVVAVWETDGVTLWVMDDGATGTIMFEKIVASAESVVRLDDLGDGGGIVTGAHILLTPTRAVAASTTVLWSEGETTLRIDGDLDADVLEAIARDLSGA